MTRCVALTLTLGTAALVMVGTKSWNIQQANRHVTQVASSMTDDADSTTRSGYIIASS